MIDYSLILTTNFEGKQFVLAGVNYENLDWLDESSKPTQSELDALWESTQATIANKKAQEEAVKTSALSKLAALGLTQDEVKALVG